MKHMAHVVYDIGSDQVVVQIPSASGDGDVELLRLPVKQLDPDDRDRLRAVRDPDRRQAVPLTDPGLVFDAQGQTIQGPVVLAAEGCVLRNAVVETDGKYAVEVTAPGCLVENVTAVGGVYGFQVNATDAVLRRCRSEGASYAGFRAQWAGRFYGEHLESVGHAVKGFVVNGPAELIHLRHLVAVTSCDDPSSDALLVDPGAGRTVDHVHVEWSRLAGSKSNGAKLENVVRATLTHTDIDGTTATSSLRLGHDDGIAGPVLRLDQMRMHGTMRGSSQGDDTLVVRDSLFDRPHDDNLARPGGRAMFDGVRFEGADATWAAIRQDASTHLDLSDVTLAAAQDDRPLVRRPDGDATATVGTVRLERGVLGI